MSFPKDMKDKFVNEFGNKQFTLDEVVDFLSPYIEVDVQKAVDQQKKCMSRNFIASFKDENKIRHFFSFRTEDGIKYTFSSGNLDIEIAKSILRNLNSKQKGLYKASRKIRKRIHTIYGQVNMFEAVR